MIYLLISFKSTKDKLIYNEQVYYKYVEHISKINQHKFKDVTFRNKEVKVYALVES